MANKEYRVHLATGEENIDPSQGREVRATTHRAAALLAFQLSAFGCPARSAFRRGETVVAWAWDAKGPHHNTGMPMCVHKLELKRGEVVASV